LKNSLSVTWVLFSVISLNAVFTNAQVIDRKNGMIYDPVQNLTWTKNADIKGRMTWNEAMEWAENLEYGGYTDWRLPTTTRFDDPSCLEDTRAIVWREPLIFEHHSDCINGEMEQLTLSDDPYNNPIFENVHTSRYWTSTPYRDGIDPCVEGDYCTIEGDSGVRENFYWQWTFRDHYKTTLRAGNHRPAWAVRDGDSRSALNFVPITPCRLFDSRHALPPDNRFVAPPPPDGKSVSSIVRHYFVWGGGTRITNQGGDAVCNIPRNAEAIHISFTSVSPIGKGWLRAWSYGDLPEAKATLLVWDGLGPSNSTAIAVNPKGDFNLTLKVYFNSVGNTEANNNSVDIVGDVVGYYTPAL